MFLAGNSHPLFTSRHLLLAFPPGLLESGVGVEVHKEGLALELLLHFVRHSPIRLPSRPQSWAQKQFPRQVVHDNKVTRATYERLYINRRRARAPANNGGEV